MKKKENFWTMILVLVVLIGLVITTGGCPPKPDGGEGEGEGEGGGENGEIKIDTIEELQLIGNDSAYPLNGNYILTRDIDASATVNWNNGTGFNPIGYPITISPFMGPFSGVFNGQ